MPFQKVPSPGSLQRQIAEMDDFIRRCNAGDETAISCVGLNVARTMSPHIGPHWSNPDRALDTVPSVDRVQLVRPDIEATWCEPRSARRS